MNFVFPLLLAGTFVTALPSQDPAPTAQQFLLDDYTTVMRVDLETLRSTGIWDELTASTLSLVFSMIESQCGFPLDRLNRVTSVTAPKRSGDSGTDGITTIEGNGDLGDLNKTNLGRYTVQRVGPYSLLRDRWMEDEVVVQVTPQLRVHGSIGQVEAALTGRPRSGLPCADVMSFTAGRKGVLLYAIADLRHPSAMRTTLQSALPDAAWPADDEPTFACLHLLATGDEDDPHLTAEVILRHATSGAGLAATEKAVTAALARLAEQKESLMLRPILKKVQHRRSGSDAVWRVDLGRARHAAGTLGMLSPFMLLASTSDAQAMPVMQVLEVVEEVEEPVPEPDKKKEVPLVPTPRKQP